MHCMTMYKMLLLNSSDNNLKFDFGRKSWHCRQDTLCHKMKSVSAESWLMLCFSTGLNSSKCSPPPRMISSAEHCSLPTHCTGSCLVNGFIMAFCFHGDLLPIFLNSDASHCEETGKPQPLYNQSTNTLEPFPLISNAFTFVELQNINYILQMKTDEGY